MQEMIDIQYQKHSSAPSITFLINMHLQDAQSQNAEVELQRLEQQLRLKIEQAKTISRDMKTNIDETDPPTFTFTFTTNSNGELIYPEFHNQVNYNEIFWKTYLKNQLNFSLVKELSERTSQLQELVKQIESINEQYFTMFKLKNRKKNRRLAVEIDKKFDCPYDKCYKVYGSDVSLNLHIKLKHNGGNKTDREKLAEEICVAQDNGLPMPEMKYSLPPGYLDEYRKGPYRSSLEKYRSQH